MKYIILLLTTFLIADAEFDEGLKALTDNDFKTAFEAFEKSQTIEANHEIARMYMIGSYVKRDEKKALEMYLKGVEADYDKSLNNAGLMIKDGIGIKADKDRGCSYLKRAADKGLMQGYLNFGKCLVEENKGKEALMYFIEAAEKGSAKAFEEIGKVYQYGTSDVEINFKNAFSMYLESGKRGNYDVKLYLIEMAKSCKKENQNEFCEKVLSKVKLD